VVLGHEGPRTVELGSGSVPDQMVPVHREDGHRPPDVPVLIDGVVGDPFVVEPGVGAHGKDLLALLEVPELGVGVGG